MFGRSLSNIQRDNFGRVNEEEDKNFQRLRQRRQVESTRSLGNLSAGVGRGQTNQRADIAKVETLMERNDSFDLTGTEGPTGLFSVGLDNAIRGFQSERSLKQDGLIFPRGETVSALVETADDDTRPHDPRLSLPGDAPPSGHDFPDETPPKQGLFAEEDGDDDEQPPAENPEPPEGEEPDPEPPKEDESKCEEEEVAWVNAGAALFIAKQNLASAQQEIKGYEQQIKNIDDQIKEKKEQLKKSERKIRGVSTVVGIGTGTLIGGFATRTPAGAAKGGEQGGSAGMEVGDGIIRVLKVRIALLERQKIPLFEKIKAQKTRVTSLKEEVSGAQAEVDEAREILVNCREGNR